MISIIIKFCFFQIALILFQCAENENPILTNRNMSIVPVASLHPVPHRKFITISDSTELLVENYNIGYDCSDITNFSLDLSGDTLRPYISVTFPNNLEDCAVVIDGLDSILSFVFNDIIISNSPKRLFFGGTGNSVSDSSILVLQKHHWLYPSTIFSFDSGTIDSGYNFYLDSNITIEVPCGDSISFGYYCTSTGGRDSLYLKLMTTWGWLHDSCDTTYPMPEIDRVFIEEIKPDTVGCSSSLKLLNF